MRNVSFPCHCHFEELNEGSRTYSLLFVFCKGEVSSMEQKQGIRSLSPESFFMENEIADRQKRMGLKTQFPWFSGFWL